MIIIDRKKLRTLRKEKSLTQEQLAESIGISDRYIRSLETQSVDPSASVLYRISRALDTPMDDFIVVLRDDNKEARDL